MVCPLVCRLVDMKRARYRPSILKRRNRRRVSSDEDEDSSEETPDVESSMVRQFRNRVYFHSEVNRKSVLDMVEKLSAAEAYALTHECDSIKLFIHSEGGDAYAGLSGMNHIQTCRVPVTTIADGFVASAATFLLLGGRVRFGMEHSTILIHQVRTGFWGKFADLVDEMQNSEQLMNILRSIYSTHTCIKKKRLDTILNKELTMTATQSIENGIIQGIYKT